MSLPTPVFPTQLWDGNEQDTANDGPADTTIAQAADHNETAAELRQVQIQLRDGVARAFHNDTGGQLDAGVLVTVDGFDATSGLPTVSKSRADAAGTLAGFVVLADTADGVAGNLAERAVVRDLDTSGRAAGDEVYLSASSSGEWTATAPTGTGFAQYVGRVTKVDAVNGEIEFSMIRPAIPDQSTVEFGANEILQVKADGIGSTEIATGAVGTAELAADAVTQAEIADDAVQKEHLHDDLADIIPQLAAITKDTEGDTGADVIRFTIQVQDAQANSLSQRHLLFVWIATSEWAEAEGTQTITINKGLRISPWTANQSYRILTDSDGAIWFDVAVTGAGTRWVHAALANAPARSLSGSWS